MPGITLNFNINITCDPAILNFLKTLQGIKPVEQRKPIMIQGIPLEKIEEKTPPAEEKRRYRNRGERITDEDLKNKIIDYIKIHQPCTFIMNKKTGNFPEDFLNSINFYNNSRIRELLIKLTEEKRVSRTREKQGNQGRTPFVYTVNNKELKVNNEKALELLKQQIIKDEEEQEEEEDVLRADTRIDVPSLERRPRREIKLKCSRCGGQLFEKNTAEENYMDVESRFLDLPEETYYQCFQCGSIFTEKEILSGKKEVLAA